jgi:hypothetical protein
VLWFQLCRALLRPLNWLNLRGEGCLVVPQTGTLKDYGLRAKEDIKKGEFVIEYVGEVIDQEEFEDRLDEYRVRGVGKLPRSDCRVILNGSRLRRDAGYFYTQKMSSFLSVESGTAQHQQARVH